MSYIPGHRGGLWRPARCQTITMKLPFLLLAVVLQVSGAASVPGATQAQLGDFAQMEQQLARAWVESDRATIDRIIASDWTTIAITGQVLTRAEVMADFFRNGKSPISAMTLTTYACDRSGKLRLSRAGRSRGQPVPKRTWSCASPISSRGAMGAGRSSLRRARALLRSQSRLTPQYQPIPPGIPRAGHAARACENPRNS